MEDLTSPVVSFTGLGGPIGGYTVASGNTPQPPPPTLPVDDLNHEPSPEAGIDHDLVNQLADTIVAHMNRAYPDAQERGIQNMLAALQQLSGPRQTILLDRLKTARKQNRTMEPGVLTPAYTR